MTLSVRKITQSDYYLLKINKELNIINLCLLSRMPELKGYYDKIEHTVIRFY